MFLVGRCKQSCPELQERKTNKPVKYLAVKNCEYSIRLSSSSGGMFSILANYVTEKNGVVYGACFDDKFNVFHKRAEKEKEWKKFKSSKYVQSDLKEIFKEIKEDLKNGRMVLFTGTPCQVAGLKKYLCEVNTKNLITCDIVCHGTPSPKIWSEYLKYLSRKNNCKIGQVNFRDKKGFGWHDSRLTILDDKGNVILKEKQNENYFFLMFFNHLILRPSCYVCNYANFNRPSDITLGDYWGIEKYHPEFDDDKGVSLVLINSENGLRIWNEVKNNVEFLEISENESKQPNLENPSKLPENRDAFWNAYEKFGLEFAGKRVGIIKRGIIFKCLMKLYQIKRDL